MLCPLGNIFTFNHILILAAFVFALTGLYEVWLWSRKPSSLPLMFLYPTFAGWYLFAWRSIEHVKHQGKPAVDHRLVDDREVLGSDSVHDGGCCCWTYIMQCVAVSGLNRNRWEWKEGNCHLIELIITSWTRGVEPGSGSDSGAAAGVVFVSKKTIVIFQAQSWEAEQLSSFASVLLMMLSFFPPWKHVTKKQPDISTHHLWPTWISRL